MKAGKELCTLTLFFGWVGGDDDDDDFDDDDDHDDDDDGDGDDDDHDDDDFDDDDDDDADEDIYDDDDDDFDDDDDADDDDDDDFDVDDDILKFPFRIGSERQEPHMFQTNFYIENHWGSLVKGGHFLGGRGNHGTLMIIKWSSIFHWKVEVWWHLIVKNRGCGLGCDGNSHHSHHQPQKNIKTCNESHDFRCTSSQFPFLSTVSSYPRARWIQIPSWCHIWKRKMNNKCSMFCDEGLLGVRRFCKL